MTNGAFDRLFGGPPRPPEAPVTQREMDLARSIQEVTEEIVLRMARHAHRRTGSENLCLAGGVALNCVANGRVLREGPFARIWIQPAAGDAGGAVGVALLVWHKILGNERHADGVHDRMRGAALGPAFGAAEIETALAGLGACYRRLVPDDLVTRTADLLAQGKVVGWFAGRMEFGPRALGGRSILADPRPAEMQLLLNEKIKFRESFRPFAPSVLRERCGEYFDLDCESPYMLLVAPVRHARRRALTAEQERLCGLEKLRVPRSDVPAVTHVDYTARIQTVTAESHPLYHRLIAAFAARTGCPLLVNTSFNVRGEPIVCSPADAYRCFMRTEMDALALVPFLLLKEEQPPSVGSRRFVGPVSVGSRRVGAGSDKWRFCLGTRVLEARASRTLRERGCRRAAV
jgi:carbamoyltransferase